MDKPLQLSKVDEKIDNSEKLNYVIRDTRDKIIKFRVNSEELAQLNRLEKEMQLETSECLRTLISRWHEVKEAKIKMIEELKLTCFKYGIDPKREL